MKDPHEPEPKPAIMLFYEGDQWDEVVERFYKENPGSQGKVSIILMPKNGKLRLRSAQL
jgi:hypothetical protein